MHIRLSPNNSTRQAALQRLHQAYLGGDIRLIRHIHALLYLADGQVVSEVAILLNLSEQTVRHYFHAFLLKGLHSLVYKRPPGRPPRLTKTQRKELADLIESGPEKAGYECGCWTCVLIQDLSKSVSGSCIIPTT